MIRPVVMAIPVMLVLLVTSLSHAAYNLEVPAEPWDEYRAQFQEYSKYLAASYDRAFIDDYDGAVREVNRAIELLPEEGIGYAERGKYYRLLNDTRQAEADYQRAIAMFDQAIERYKPGKDTRQKRGARRFKPADAGKLVATLRFQRGENHFNFEQYRKASDDFAAACQGGHTAACGRIWDIKGIEKRGSQWVPLAARQFYDRSRITRFPPTSLWVWIRREDPQPVAPSGDSDTYIQQRLELNCASREFRLVEALAFANGSQAMAEKVTGSTFARPVAGSAPARLITILCGSPQAGNAHK